MRTPRRLSELECFVLGLIWQLGPCSPYDVRRHMQRSPSTQWSGSAGAIYPLIARLHRRGLLASRKARHGKRQRREYSITPRGEKTLKHWIGPPLAPDAITVSYDPLRSRARFLGVMKPHERRAWIAAALDALDEVERRVEAWHDLYAAADDRFAAAMTRHGEMDLQWRRRWLEELRDSIA